MANLEREFPLGFKDKRHTQATTATVYTDANYADVSSLRARLATIDGTYYTSARLDKMTKNDMVYAVRLADDAAGVK
jgi:hypothetical protein